MNDRGAENTGNHAEIVPPTRSDFRQFFARKYGRLLKAAVTPSERRPDYKDPAVVAGIVSRLQAQLTDLPTDSPDNIPRHIFLLWQQGWDAAPPLVKACGESWQHHNPGWEVHLLDETSLGDFAPAYGSLNLPKASRQARSDLARLALLAEHGGVWVDASLFCAQPLDKWLPACPDNSAFLFTWPRPYRELESWFMAAPPQSKLVKAWLAICTHYWTLFSRPHHYYWMHYLFEMLLERRPDLVADWQQGGKLSAMAPLIVGGISFDTGAPQPVFDLIGQGSIPVHKLSHKWRFDGSLDGTPAGRLTGLGRL